MFIQANRENLFVFNIFSYLTTAVFNELNNEFEEVDSSKGANFHPLQTFVHQNTVSSYLSASVSKDVGTKKITTNPDRSTA